MGERKGVGLLSMVMLSNALISQSEGAQMVIMMFGVLVVMSLIWSVFWLLQRRERDTKKEVIRTKIVDKG